MSRAPTLLAATTFAFAFVGTSCGGQPASPDPDASSVPADVAAITPGPGCDAVDPDNHYRCAFTAIPSSAQFLFTRLSINELHAASLDASFALADTTLFAPPTGWHLLFSAASPDHEHLLLTMYKPGCPPSWPDPAGETCSWGRFTLWLAERSPDGLAWDLTNLRSLLGENSAIVGWSTWLTNRHAIFNAKARPATQPLTMPGERSGDAYELSLSPTPTVEHWSANVEDPHCFIGRLHAVAHDGDSCVDGQLVTMTRRCDDEPVGPSAYSWYNNTAVDGSGAACRGDVQPPELVPVFRNYVVEVDASCKVKAFDRAHPVRSPDYTGLFRQMGTGMEWGDGQATISADGTTMAFWTMRGYEFSSPTDPCAAFASQDGTTAGNGAARVRTCTLDGTRRCTTATFLPPPASPWQSQQQAYFYRGAATSHLAVLTTEGTGTAFTDLVTGAHRTVIEDGFGGYPLEPH